MSSPSRETTLLVLEHPRRLTVSDYHRMIEAGIFDEDERVELLEGLLISVTPQREDHAHVIQVLDRALNRALGDEYVVRVQLPLTLGAESEPEPDVAVVRSTDAQSRAHPPERAQLVIEVSGESLRKDRRVKGAIYARARIPEYWIVNLVDRCLEVHRDPDPGEGRYISVETVRRGESVRSTAVAGVSISVSALLD